MTLTPVEYWARRVAGLEAELAAAEGDAVAIVRERLEGARATLERAQDAERRAPQDRRLERRF